MAKIGRNDPCPCGSGKKNKKCCAMTEAAPALSVRAPIEPHHVCASCGRHVDELDDDRVDEINERADHILDELLDGRVDAADALCQGFIRDFPGEAEGLDLLSMVAEERGQRERALDLARQASKIAHERSDYDAETRALMRERIKELELRA